MKYVLDASVALRWVLPHPLASKAIRLRADFLNQIHELLAPDVFPGEVANALTKAERQKMIAVGQALPLIMKILKTPPVLHAYSPLLPRGAQISSQTRSGFYDCLYVALAEREVCELVTLDDKLVNNLKLQFPFVVSLASLP